MQALGCIAFFIVGGPSLAPLWPPVPRAAIAPLSPFALPFPRDSPLPSGVEPALFYLLSQTVALSRCHLACSLGPTRACLLDRRSSRAPIAPVSSVARIHITSQYTHMHKMQRTIYTVCQTMVSLGTSLTLMFCNNYNNGYLCSMTNM